MGFKSDNILGVHPQIMQAILSANNIAEASYGNDRFANRKISI